MPYSRTDRVGGLIQEVLSELIKKDIHDPRLKMVTITKVKMSRDLKLARIYYSIYGGDTKTEAAADGFESARGFIKRSLAHRLSLRYMPDLSFFYDESFDYGSHIEELLSRIATENDRDNQTN